MIALADPKVGLDRELLDVEGGFAWWYADLLDEEMNGCVVIWSFGLPFLPGRESAARRGQGAPCRQRPSVNVAIYRHGRAVAYVLQEHPESAATWHEGTESVRIGRSCMRTERVDEGRVCLLDLDLDLPDGRRLQGQVRIQGNACRYASKGTDPRHQWSPLCTAARGSASFTVDGEPLLDVDGRAYHDRNGSVAPLDGLGIRHWLWGRAPVGDDERIWYLLWPDKGEPTAWGLTVSGAGEVRVHDNLEVQRSPVRIGRFGMPWWRRLSLGHGGERWLDVDHYRLVDNGFFYQRWLTRVRAPDGRVGVGTAEAVRPGRVDRAWNRWLVRMAVHRVGQRNSPFLPMFSGVRGSRPAGVIAPAQAR